MIGRVLGVGLSHGHQEWPQSFSSCVNTFGDTCRAGHSHQVITPPSKLESRESPCMYIGGVEVSSVSLLCKGCAWLWFRSDVNHEITSGQSVKRRLLPNRA